MSLYDFDYCISNMKRYQEASGEIISLFYSKYKFQPFECKYILECLLESLNHVIDERGDVVVTE